MTTHSCHQHVFSGARWDIRGHGCSNPATVEEPDDTGEMWWWCKRHAPSRVAAREERDKAARSAAYERHAQLVAEHEALVSRLAACLSPELGRGVRVDYGSRYGATTLQVTGVHLSRAAAEALLELLDSLGNGS